MLRFFSKIRYKLASENRVAKYMRYAIGEILLVVIGILIALQVNNWNETRINKAKEKVLLENLNAEFKQNKIILTELRELVTETESIYYLLMNLMNKSNEELLNYNIDSLLYYSLETLGYNPSNNIVTEILQSGKVHLITNHNLKNALFEWSRKIDQNKITYSLYEKWLKEQVLAYYSKNIALKNIDKYSPMAWKTKSEFDSGYNSIFNDREYENIIDNELYEIALLKEEYQEINLIIDSIIDLTE